VYPEIAHWGPIHIRSYGLMLAVAFLVGTWIALREARRLRLDEDKLVSVILVTLVASVFGARLLYVLEHLPDYRRNWSSVLALWEGGLTLYGGVVAGAAAGLWMARRLGLPMWTVADALTPSVALGTAFGRVGCLLNGCCYGRPTTLPWGIVYPPDSFPGLEFGSTPIHPSQAYFAIAGLGLFLLLWSIRKRMTLPGQLFWLFIVLFSLVRVPLDFTRAYEPDSVLGRVGGLDVTESQLISLTLALFGLLMMARLRRQRLAPAPAGSSSSPA
jgi:phosphatidylglycerol---prolipoprotein diacylglyceryl transferase